MVSRSSLPWASGLVPPRAGRIVTTASGLLHAGYKTLVEPGRAWPLVRAARRSCLPIYRLSYLMDLCSAAPEGAFVECGTFRGGSASILARNDEDRDLWLFDSWDGFPDTAEVDADRRGQHAARGDFSAAFEDVAAFLVQRCRISGTRLHLRAGWFEDTLPVWKDEIGPIALLHIDCDLYSSTRTCLSQLFDHVVEGGVVVVDDYGDWDGCRRACDEFLAERKSMGLTIRVVDSSQVVLTRTGSP